MSDTCTYYRYRGGFFGPSETCSVSGDEVGLPSGYYNRYCKHGYVRDCPRYRQYGPYQSTGCFITTIVCDTLGMEDNVSYLETLREFRNNVLQNNDKYKGILATYDVVGPVISCRLAHDKNRKQIASNLFNLGIKNVCKLLDDNKVEEAVGLYSDMTNLLIRGYGINESVSDDYLNNMDMKHAGHGKKLVRE